MEQPEGEECSAYSHTDSSTLIDNSGDIGLLPLADSEFSWDKDAKLEKGDNDPPTVLVSEELELESASEAGGERTGGEHRENEVAPECNAEAPPCSDIVLLINVPLLVTEEILKHLNSPDKLCLRATCKTTKEWVDTPQFLTLFKVSISSVDDMTKLIQYSKEFQLTHWKNVSFLENNYASYDLFPSFVSTFSSFITSLHLRHFNGGLAQILFLSSCATLKHLKIDEMDVRQNPALLVASDKSLKAKCPKLLDIFTELKTLHIGLILFNEVKSLSFYQTFLQRCRKLERLNIPRPQGPPTISWETVKSIQLKSIITPISEYLRKKPITNPLKTDIQVLDMEGLFSRHFPSVAEACVQIGAPTLFENVNEKHVKYLFINEGDVLKKILSLKEKIDDRRPVSKWDRLERLYVRSSRCDVRDEYPNFTAYPSLKFLTLVMDSKSREDINFGMLQRLIKLLILTERENLREFTLQWPLFSHDTPQDYIRGHDFAGNFLNLTKLHLSGWMVPDEDFVLLWNVLGKLRQLILEECCLTDQGLIGDGHSSGITLPAVMNLKDLVHLEIRNRSCRGSLTDDSFSHALMHMRLHHLVVESFHVTQKAYVYLADGDFKWTIRKLPTPQVLPRGISNEDEYIQFIVSHFPNVVL